MKKYYQLKKVDLKLIFIVFIFAKILGVATIFFASQILPPENFPYKDILDKFYLPHLWMSFANFDGIQYIAIAREGYYNFNQAFFPMYPLLLRFTGQLLNHNYIFAGILLSNTFFICALYIFVKLLRDFKISEKNIFWIVLSLIFFPTSFFFSAVYPTSFFLFILMLFFYGFHKNKLIFIILPGVLAGITVINGVLLSISVFCIMILNRKIDIKAIVGVLSPLVGLGIYSYYLQKTTNDALYYFHSQVAFGANRSTDLVLLPQVVYRYIKIFLTSDLNYQLFIAYLEFVVFLIAFGLVLYFFYFIYKNKNENYRTMLLIGLFSLGNILISPLTGTFTSTPRYVLYSICIFIVLPFIVKRNKYRYVIIIISIIFQIILLAFFSQGYFVS